MNKVNIVFDIDNTITNETDFIKKEAPNYLKIKYNIEVNEKNSYGSDIVEIYGLYEVFKEMDKMLMDEELNYKCKKVKSSFMSTNFLRYIFQPLKKDASSLINELKRRGYTINFVTLRGIKTKENEKPMDLFIRKIVVPLLTHMQLKLNGIKYDKLYMVEKAEEKQLIIRDLNASLVFEDSVEVIESLKDVDTITICIENPHNILINFDNKRVIKTKLNYKKILSMIETLEQKKLEIVDKNEKNLYCEKIIQVNNLNKQISNLKEVQTYLLNSPTSTFENENIKERVR